MSFGYSCVIIEKIFSVRDGTKTFYVVFERERKREKGERKRKEKERREKVD